MTKYGMCKPAKDAQLECRLPEHENEESVEEVFFKCV